MDNIAVIGAGAWGTALAMVAHRARQARRTVRLWARETSVVDSIQGERENKQFLPGIPIDPEITATGDLAVALDGAEMVLLAAPAQHTRAMANTLLPHLPSGCPIVLCAKGIEQDSGALMSEAVSAAAPEAPLAVLSGPTFAAEVARHLPTAVTVAARDIKLGEAIAQALGGKHFRPYASDDPIGAQVGGAIKNVIAIACGIADGRRFGDNARAALITRGLAEMVRLTLAKGGRAETMMGLSGLGDLTLTCTGVQSRNMSLGIALGEGRSLDEVLAERNTVAEGVWTARSVTALAGMLGVDMPISAAVDAILHHGAEVDAVLESLLTRPLKTEHA